MGACIRKRVMYDMLCKRFHFFVNVEALSCWTLHSKCCVGSKNKGANVVPICLMQVFS